MFAQGGFLALFTAHLGTAPGLFFLLARDLGQSGFLFEAGLLSRSFFGKLG